MRKLKYTLLLCLALCACHHPEVQFTDFDTFQVYSVKSSFAFNEDGSLNTKTIVFYTSRILLQSGLSGDDYTPQQVAGVWIYPKEYFCPMDHTRGNWLRITGNTRSIHHYDASWLDRSALHRFLARIKKWLVRRYYSIKECLS